MIARSPFAPNPILFMMMYLPYGIALGYFIVTLPFVLAQAGVSTAAIGIVCSIVIWLQVAKIVWAPVADAFLTYRTLYAIACMLVAVSMAGAGLVPATAANVPLLCGAAVLVGAATGLVGDRQCGWRRSGRRSGDLDCDP